MAGKTARVLVEGATGALGPLGALAVRLVVVFAVARGAVAGGLVDGVRVLVAAEGAAPDEALVEVDGAEVDVEVDVEVDADDGEAIGVAMAGEAPTACGDPEGRAWRVSSLEAIKAKIKKIMTSSVQPPLSFFFPALIEKA